MTAITVHWKSEAGSWSLAITEGGFHGGNDGPDVFCSIEPDRACIVLANGYVGVPYPGVTSVIPAPHMIGQYAITVAGETKVPWTAATIRFGCAEVIRLGKPTQYRRVDGWDQYWLKDFPTDEAAAQSVKDRLAAMSFEFDDTGFQNPDQSGSARVCQFAWAGTMAACLGIDIDRVRAAAEHFTDFQLRWRHAFFYDSSGKQLRAHEQPWWRVGASGWDGQVKLTIDSPYKFESCQHLAPDRFIKHAVAFDDFAAKLYSDAYIEAVLTRPEFRSSQLADDQRSHGYCMRLAALWSLIGAANGNGYAPSRNEALLRVVDGWRRANGFAFTGEPYASIAPAHTGAWSHGYPSLVDWEPYAKQYKIDLPAGLLPPEPGETCDHLRPFLKALALERGLISNAYTDGKDGLWQGHTIVWQTGVALGALCFLRDVPAAAALVPDIDKLIQHATACITGPGSRPGIGVTGITLQPNPFVDAYVSRFPQRVAPGGGKNATATWLPNPLLSASFSCGENLRLEAQELAAQEWEATDFPHPPSLETCGLLPIKLFGPKG